MAKYILFDFLRVTAKKLSNLITIKSYIKSTSYMYNDVINSYDIIQL